MNNQEKVFNINDIKLIVGLGNPGKDYFKTRHNAGFLFLDSWNTQFLNETKFKSEISTVVIDNNKLLLAKPNTYMNSSGDAVVAIARFYKINPSQILIAHDDLDIKLGEYKLQFNKGPKVHNGILSVENKLSTTEFWRLRIGIDNRTDELRQNINGADYVLGRFAEDELNKLSELFSELKTLINYSF